MSQTEVRKAQLEDIPSHVKMIMASIKSFAKDGKYSIEELERIMVIALEDGEVNGDEKRVLGDILTKASSTPFDDQVKPYIEALRKLYL